jgi:YD repeat-containing protein
LGFSLLSKASSVRLLRGYGLSVGAMAGCVLCGVVLAPVITRSQATTTFAGRCFDYDGAGRLIGVRDEGGNVRAYGLDPASNRKGVTASGGGAACSGAGVPTPATVILPPPPLLPENNNRVPVANSDTATVSAFGNVKKSVMVLANDTDPDGDPLQITDASYDASMVQVTKLATPTSGGKFIFLEIIGVDEGVTPVQYTISDGRGGQATGVVNVTVTGTGLQ